MQGRVVFAPVQEQTTLDRYIAYVHRYVLYLCRLTTVCDPAVVLVVGFVESVQLINGLDDDSRTLDSLIPLLHHVLLRTLLYDVGVDPESRVPLYQFIVFNIRGTRKSRGDFVKNGCFKISD